MGAAGRAFQVISAGSGFFTGYLWAVMRWAERAMPGSESLIHAAVLPGVLLSSAYAMLLTLLFWSRIPSPTSSGLRAVVSPAAFTLSLFAGALGIRLALRVLG